MPFKIALVGSKGDWKYEKEFYEMIRCWSTLQICTGCPATATPKFPFTDYCPDACWLAGLLTEAESRSLMDNPLMQLSYWTCKMIWSDILHCVLWGCGRDFVSSVIKLLLWSCLFGAGSWEQRVMLAFASFLSWCQRFGFKPSITTFAVRSATGIPHINGKAFDVKLMIGWLAEAVLGYADENGQLLRATAFNLARPLFVWFYCIYVLLSMSPM